MNAKHASIDKLVCGKSADELSRLVIAVALNESDVVFAELVCFRLAESRHDTVRGNSLLGFGHIARRSKSLTEQIKIMDLLRAGLNDASEYVRGQASTALDDIEHFIQK